MIDSRVIRLQSDHPNEVVAPTLSAPFTNLQHSDDIPLDNESHGSDVVTRQLHLASLSAAGPPAVCCLVFEDAACAAPWFWRGLNAQFGPS